MPRVTITVPDKTAQPYRFQLDREVVTLGRGSENDIAIDSGSVSVNHAEMRRISGGYELRDIGSTNGIKLDGTRYETIPLRSGSSVRIGDVTFDFTLTEEELDALALEKSATGLPPIKSGSDEPSPKVAQQRPSYAAAQSSGSGFGAALMFIILAAIAFFAGLAIRHQKETGTSLIDAIRNRGVVEAPATTPEAQK